MNVTSPGTLCPACSSPLEHDGFCLACPFREAAASGDERSAESWEAGALPVSAMAFSQDGKILAACTGDTVLYDAGSAARELRRERLRLTIRMQRNWIQFAGQDKILLHCGPWRPLEVWETSD